MIFKKISKLIVSATAVCVMLSAVSPITAVYGAKASKSTATKITETDIGGDIVFSGNVGVNNSLTSLLVYSGHNYTAGSSQNIIYFDQGKTDDNGDYSFTVKKAALTDKYTVQVSAQGSKNVLVEKLEKPSGIYRDFEDYTGGLPKGFTTDYNSNHINTYLKSESVDSAHGNSLVVKNKATGINYIADEVMSGSRVIRMGFSIYTRDFVPSLFYIRLLDSRWVKQDNANDPYMYESFSLEGVMDENEERTSGNIGYYRGSQGWQRISLCDFEPNKWYDVEMWLDGARERIVYVIYQNGVKVGEAETDINLEYNLKGARFNFYGGADIAFDNFYLEYMDWSKREALMAGGGYVPDGLTEECEITVDSDNVGNIFYGGNEPKLNLNFKNLNNHSKAFDIDVSVKDYDGAEVWKNSYHNREIDGETTEAISFVPTLLKYGVYTVDVYVDGKLLHTADVSRCVDCDYINEKMGVCAHYDRSGGDSVDTVNIAKAAGISSIRADWWRDEKLVDGKPVYPDSFKTNERFSAYIAESDKLGVDKLALIDVNSSLYKDDDGGIYTTPEALTALENYCEWFARTYKNTIKYIEVGNEIDYGRNSDGNQIPAADYYKALKAAYTGIKKGNPEAKVLLSSIFIVYDSRTMKDGKVFKCLDWFKELLDIMKAEGKYYFDIVATHPYWIAGAPEMQDRWSNGLNWITKSTRLIDTLKSYDLGDVEIWGTEIGYHNAAGGYNYSEEQSAAYTVRWMLLNDVYDLYDKLYFYCLYNEGSDPKYDENNFGLVKTWKKISTPLAAKAVYPSIAFYNKIMRGAKYVDGDVPEISSNGMSGKFYQANFKDANRDIKVVWNSDRRGTGNIDGNMDNVSYEVTSNETVSISTNPTYVYDMYGNLINAYTGQTSVNLTVGREPIYIVTDNSPVKITAGNSEVTSVKEFKSFKTVSVSCAENGILVAAQYDKNGTLIKVDYKDSTGGTTDMDVTYKDGCDSMKVMVFKSWQSIAPLVGSKQI